MRGRVAMLIGLLTGFLAAGAVEAAANVTRLEVRIATGADGAGPGGTVELRLRELGRPERRVPLGRGDAWPAHSVRIVPVTLAEPIDPEAVSRVGIYYRTANAAAPDAWEIASAEVVAIRGSERIALSSGAIQGVLLREGELSSAEHAASTLTCVQDADCNDGRSCNGVERCQPGARTADARGCVRGSPVQCPVNQACIEGQGCRGVGEAAAAAGGLAIGSPRGDAGEKPNTAPNLTPQRVPVQTCSGRDVLLTDGGSSRIAACPAGTACVPQPNGTGVCAPAAR